MSELTDKPNVVIDLESQRQRKNSKKKITKKINVPLIDSKLQMNWVDSPSLKADFVKNLFGTISQTYDRTNDFITFGLARLWRKNLVQWSGAQLGHEILDCATGTGDLAFEFKKTVGASGAVTGIDFCQEMLDRAPDKSLNLNLPVAFELANVLALHFENKKFNVTSMAYGIRNVADVSLAINEMARVTKSGGNVMILETGEVVNPILRIFIRLYFEKIVPLVGGWISGQPHAYQYLQKSSGQFPSGQGFCDILQNSNLFSVVEFKTLMGGASYIYKATVKIS